MLIRIHKSSHVLFHPQDLLHLEEQKLFILFIFPSYIQLTLLCDKILATFITFLF